MSEGRRDLLSKLQALIFELVDINQDIATLEVKDAITSARRAKKAMLHHTRNAEAFKKELDEIRHKILLSKTGLTEEDIEAEDEPKKEEKQKEVEEKQEIKEEEETKPESGSESNNNDVIEEPYSEE